MGLATHYFGCLESSYNSEKTRACATNQLTGLYMSQGIQKWAEQNLWKTAFRKFKVIGSAWTDHTISNFLKVVSHKFYLVHSGIT